MIISGRYFVYFYGPDFEYTWSDANTLIPYSGLQDFIQQAETAVQNVRVILDDPFRFYLNIFRQQQKANKKHWQLVLN